MSLSSRFSTPTPRPTSARPHTAASSRPEGSHVIALIEGRGIAREVGMAALDKDTGRVIIVQLSDCSTYVKTVHQMNLHYPSLILVPDTFLSSEDTSTSSGSKKASLLLDCIRDEFEGVPVEPVSRKYWNENIGLQFITELSLDDEERAATLVSSSNKYYALSAACALFKHAEIKLNTRYVASSLRIRYCPVEGTMMIDSETIRNLELIGNMSSRRSSHSLYGVLNHTFTPMGARLLKVNILSPITVKAVIDSRLDAVEEIIQSEQRFTETKLAMKMLVKHDLDKLIASLVTCDSQQASKSSAAVAARVVQMLNLRNVVRNLPALAAALQGYDSDLLRIIGKMVSDERIKSIETLISNSLNEDTAQNVPKGGIGALNVKVYAVKANYNRLLDVARETFKENVGDIYQLSRELSERHSIPISIVYQESGFVFALKKSELEGELPSGFVNVTNRKGKLLFSSMELKKRNARMKDALDEALFLSDRIIRELVSDVLEHIGALYKASEAIALLDTLWSFAHTSILRNYEVRPEFTGTLAIKAGRHPILEVVQSAGSLVPNDSYCCDASSFQVIQGPNMAGKSTYLRQVGLLTVMAMCGCFVPAEYASFRIHDALLTRLSNDDDMERSLSTFANEMATCAMILGLATSTSLVLIDEVGRGTSPEDGIGIAHSLAEALIKLRCFVLFTTHFHELSTTLSRQPTVVNMHLSVQNSRPTNTTFGMVFEHKIIDGAPEQFEHYGLQLAKLADFPDDVITEATKVARHLADRHSADEAASQSSKIAERRKALIRLRTQLNQVMDHSLLPDEELAEYLARVQRETTAILRATL